MKASPGGFVRYTNSEYYADLVNAGNYTPPASFMGIHVNEDGQLDGDRHRMQAYDGGGWVNIIPSTPYQDTIYMIQGTNQTLRVANDKGAPNKIWFVGVLWS